MEFVLKHATFSHLRDVSDMPESICPCHPQSMTVIENLLDQVLSLHKDSSYVHIGCDEVFHLGECEHCQQQTRADVFVNHVAKVAKYVKVRESDILHC